MYLQEGCSLRKCGLLLGKFQPFNHLSMNSLSLCICFLHLALFQVKAQTSANQYGVASPDAVSNFQPSLAVVIGILAIMFSLTFILLLYAKFCRSTSSNSVRTNLQITDGLPRSRSRFSGIDKTVIESLPFFRFSSLKGSREGLECAICLSKFEDIEVLRLLPKCKHAFHINCLDEWLEKHSSCPLCRHKISADDLSSFTYSNSLRFMWNEAELKEESNMELYVQREESCLGSSRFSIASSFRKTGKDVKEDELPIQLNGDADENGKIFHKFNHKIVVSDVVLMKNRWSNVSSADLMFLNSEMLNHVSSNRFSALESGITGQSTPTRVIGDGELMNIKQEMDRKREFEIKFSKIQHNDSFPPLPNFARASSGSKGDSRINESNVLNPSEKRSMSEIIVHPRFREFNTRNNDDREPFNPENSVKEEKIRRLWLPIARRTAQWFANRERGSTQPQNTRQSLNA
ncbi:E3 ubiquitin-protein ligase ATL42-like [Coffea arabica]|uniref:E3 ubiquitin-protein ligase ATL42-like n=1 Tax=Coffea arabica TaxID=13443 RepID=A0A6P6SWW1_COFAR